MATYGITQLHILLFVYREIKIVNPFEKSFASEKKLK
jgi:hypothetical protein